VPRTAGPVLRRGRRLAARLGVPLRAAYVWSDCRPPECAHHRRCHRDLDEACRLLTALIEDQLPVDAARQVERDVVHATDPANALLSLSASASLLVVSSSSDSPRGSSDLGGTTRRLLGRTGCPVMVVPRVALPRTSLL
jgi:nucleotide-binding universal stress UspA family protein